MVIIEKNPLHLIGSFTQAIINNNIHLNDRFEITAKSDGELITDDNIIDKLIKSLTQLQVTLYFLPDDRKVQADFSDDTLDTTPPRQPQRSTEHLVPSYLRAEARRLLISYRDEPDTADSHHLKISSVLAALSESLRTQALQGSNTGEENAGSIYLRVIERLKEVSWRHDQPAIVSDSSFIQRLQHLNTKIIQFSRFGLPVGFPGDKLIAAFNGASPQDRAAIQGVLEPYLEGLEARLSAMEQLHTIISTYVETVNQFFSGKLLDLDVQSGIIIRSKWNRLINPNFLSSGERQLLLLLSNTILARGKATIFIIDEPELSLNITWQRQLVAALLKCSFGGGVQYILASHSLELITQYQDRTSRLVSLDEH
jgi:AAA domain, putative AbiEii toxin, Type IV TA system